jgi:hypothetical protein
MPPYLSSTCDYSLFLQKQHNSLCGLLRLSTGELWEITDISHSKIIE